MMTAGKAPSAGALNERVSVLQLTQTETGWAWSEGRRTWAQVSVATRTNVWSIHGVGATGVVFQMRRQMLTLDDALLWKGRHCFITSITPLGKGHLEVKAALVEVSDCAYEGTTFPAVLTEKYLKYEQGAPMALNVLTYVLVTPKEIELPPGGLVDVGGEVCHILTAHIIDPFKNEYEIQRECDL